jgi:anti-sigma factor RsiW
MKDMKQKRANHANRAYHACYDDGMLRAYLDNELPETEHDVLGAHLPRCTPCQERLDSLRAQAHQVETLLAGPAAPPDPHAAFERMRPRLAAQPAACSANSQTQTFHMKKWRKSMQKGNITFWNSGTRALVAGLAACLLLVGLLMLPPVRALAEQFLQIFRVQKVMFLPISAERLSQIESLEFDGTTLFVTEPEIINEPAEPRTFAQRDEAEAVVGYALHEPATLPTEPISVEYTIHDEHTTQFQVNVESMHELLALLDITDVTIPDELGEQPITASVPPTALTHYEGTSYDLMLHQGTGPEVSLPEGVDLAQPGKAMLRLLGLDEQQADELSREIDWNSTLIFPFPADMETISQVTVGSTEGLLVESDDTMQLYWSQDERFYVLIGEDISRSHLLTAAESVQ